jgi:hypothetical protein
MDISTTILGVLIAIMVVVVKILGPARGYTPTRPFTNMTGVSFEKMQREVMSEYRDLKSCNRQPGDIQVILYKKYPKYFNMGGKL